MLLHCLGVLILQLACWVIGYLINRLTGALVGITVGTVLGVAWHSFIYFINTRKINKRYHGSQTK